MLWDLSGNDLSKVALLKASVPKKILYERYYLARVAKLNELLDRIGYLKSL